VLGFVERGRGHPDLLAQVLARLGPSESAGLEQLFFELTSNNDTEPAAAQESAR